MTSKNQPETLQEQLRNGMEALRAHILTQLETIEEQIGRIGDIAPPDTGDAQERLAALEAKLADIEFRHRIEIALIHAAYSVDHNGPPHGVPLIAEQIAVLEKSERFEADWYLETFSDLADSKMTPAEHYVRRGAYEGRDPGPGFDSMAYYLANPDIAQSGWPALVHYEMYGAREGRALSR